MSDCVYPCPEGFIADTLNISKKLRSLEIGNVVVLIIYDNQLAAILLLIPTSAAFAKAKFFMEFKVTHYRNVSFRVLTSQF